MTRAPVLFALCAALALPACTSVEELPDGNDGAGGKADEWGDTDGDAQQLPELRHAYALSLESTLTTRDKQTGELKELTTSTFSRLSVVSEGAAVHMLLRPCAVALPEVSGYQPTLDEAVIRGLEPIALEGVLTVAEDGTVMLATEPAALQLGISLADPVADEVPSEPSEASVIDQDADGKPGVSVHVAGFRVFVGVRVLFDVAAPIEDVDAIVGTPEVDVSTRVYGDTIPFFDARDAAEEAAANNERVAERHTLRLDALSAGADPMSCDD